jgi:prevent-host-death family protein
MRTISESEATAHFDELLNAVERGETIIITRQGCTVARLLSETTTTPEERRHAIEQLNAFRTSMPSLSLEEFLGGGHEGHRYR